jgi:transcriptional regulator with XRE-family HTH domain
MQAVSYIPEPLSYICGMPQGRPAQTKRPQLGERIAQARTQAGLTQKQLAQKLGTTQRVVTYWEREALGLRAEQLVQLAEALGVSADYFLGRQTKKRGSGPTGKARLVFERVSQLPRFQQQRILSTVEDMLIAQSAKSGKAL